MTLGGHWGAIAAVAISALAIVLNLMCVPMLINRLTIIRKNVEAGVNEFKVISDQAYSEMSALKIKMGSAGSRKVRQSSRWSESNFAELGTGSHLQAVQGNQRSFSEPNTRTKDTIIDPRCPPGTTGSPGLDGYPGANGLNGFDGEPGLDGNMAPGSIDEEGCIICPQGPQGEGGPDGPQGAPGQKGISGINGNPGSDGWPGPVGPRGFVGKEGAPGKQGIKGQPGKPAPGGKGEFGPVGARGPIGRAGPQGPEGKPGYKSGPPGPIGKSGQRGIDGYPGQDGIKGVKGEQGVRGGDAKYCPCPKEVFQTTQFFRPNPTTNPGWNPSPRNQNPGWWHK